MEPVTIVITTWHTDKQRIQVAQETLKSWVKNLSYSGELHLHIADDGSTLDMEAEKFWKGLITYSRQERHGVGASLNVGFKKAFETSPFVAYFVDDWRLDQSLNIDPWVRLLKEREDVGIVRLGPPHPHLFGKIEPMTEDWQGWALRLDRHGLGVGHRPEIFHKRMIDYYGWFVEEVNAQECERLYSVEWGSRPGPDIVYALEHKWWHYHLDVLPSTSHIDPSGENYV